MRILVDEAIPGRDELFGLLGEVRPVIGRSISSKDLHGADAIVVRSVTPIDARLLAGSQIRFVGTATAGVDHVDTAWLAQRGITFASAAGCNARPVSEYVLACLLMAFDRLGKQPAGRTLGVIGVGRVGRRVAELGRRLGMRILLNDPPRARLEGGGAWAGLDDVLESADAVTLHVPLSRTSPDATAGLIDAPRLSRLRPGAIFINTARGEVVDEAALLARLSIREPDRVGPNTAREPGRAGPDAALAREGALAFLAIDAWCREPDINPRLVLACDVATPHVAGYSKQAKKRAAAAVFLQLAHWCGTGLDAAAIARRFAGGDVQTPDDSPAALDADASRDADAILHGLEAMNTHDNAASRVQDASPARSDNTAAPHADYNPPSRVNDAAARQRLDADALRQSLLSACPIESTTARMKAAAQSNTLATQFDEIRREWNDRDEC